MNEQKSFRMKPAACAVMLALASPFIVQTVYAGAGVASSTGLNGAPKTVPTYFANSPAGTWTDWSGTVHNSGTPLRKFVDQLAPLGCAAPTPTLGQCIPIAQKETTPTYPGSDYYSIGIVEYTEKMHSDLPKATTLRGYVQLETPNVTTSKHIPLTYPNGSPITDAAGNQIYAVDKPHNLGPLISATSGTPVRIKFSNLLPTGHYDPVTNSRGGDLFLPVDKTLMGAGAGPLRDPSHQIGTKTLTLSDGVTQVTQPEYEQYTENRTVIHLHGGDSPWVSDGTPHQWTAPAGEATDYKTGASFQDVPDMPNPGEGSGTLFWTNHQSGRLMFYHDHAVGITRLNVYAGEVAGYLISDPVEATLPIPGTAVTDQIPLIIQDKTFVPNDIAQQDSKWDTTHWGQPGDLWFPHVYETNQDPTSFDGTNPPGRWDWGPWFWPVFPSTYALPDGSYGNVTTTPEAFMDTPVINGTAYPTLKVEPKAYRFRLLDATNDRFLNLGLYQAEPMTIALVSAGSGYSAPVVTITAAPGDTGTGATATAVLSAFSSITVTSGGSNYSAPTVAISAPNIVGGIQATAAATLAVSSIGVTNGGTGYTAPVVTISPPPAGGIQATATATIDATGAITSITVTSPGSGYTTAPLVTISDATGTGATASVNAVVNAVALTNAGSGYTTTPTITISDLTGTGATAVAASGITGITVTNPGTGYTLPPTVTITDPTGTGASAVASVNSEVKMVAASAPLTLPLCSTTGAATNPTTGLPTGAGVTCWPNTWPADGRVGGVPDPATVGPKIIQIGNEGGLLPAPAVIPSQPTNFEYNRRSITVLNVSGPNGLYMGPAERADVVVDFSQYAGKTLILYNDAPAPNPGFDPRVDYFTGDPDQTAVGGAATTLPGFGPNTRTIMQIVVAPAVTTAPTYPTTATGAINEATLDSALPVAYAATQPMPIVPEAAYNTAFGQTWTNTYAKIYTGTNYLGQYQPMTFVTPEAITYKAATGATTTAPTTLTTAPAGSTVSVYVENKAIQELFGTDYGRMNATLGVELPFTTSTIQTTIPLGYVDPATESITDGETAFWKITHNGVDTHPVHFHLVNVQLIDRIGWDGTVKPPLPDEVGWKDTIKMNPLEDVVVAVRAKKPVMPGFGLPQSVRPMSPSEPLGSSMGFMQINPTTGNPMTVVNALANFDNEYLWHCHILGHEENDFMRPVVLKVPETPPIAATLNTVTAAPFDTTTYAQSVNLGWTDNSTNEYQFRIERAVGNGAYSAVGTALANGSSFIDTTAATGTTFNYRVMAVGAGGTTPSNVVSVTIPGTFVAAPTNLTATIVSATSISLSWTDNANNDTGFLIERSDNGGAYAQVGTAPAGVKTGSTVTFTDTTAVLGHTYSYRVKAITTVAPGGASLYAYDPITDAIPLVPTGLTASAVRKNNNTDTVTLAWTDNANNETSFTVQSATDPAFTTGLVTTAGIAANSTSIKLSVPRGNVPPGVTYYFRIQASNALGASPWSDYTSAVTQ